MKFNLFLVTITGKEKGSGPSLSSILFFPYYKFPPKKRKERSEKEKIFFVPAEEGEKFQKWPTCPKNFGIGERAEINFDFSCFVLFPSFSG